MNLLEFLREHLHGILGICQIPLTYAVHVNVAPVAIGHIINMKPFSDFCMSFYKELIERVNHDHVNFVDDNATVLDICIGCLSDMEYFTSLRPF